MNIIPAVSVEDKSPSPGVSIYHLALRPNKMSKPVAVLVVVGLCPFLIPVALIWGLFIGATWLTELWYRAWEELFDGEDWGL